MANIAELSAALAAVLKLARDYQRFPEGELDMDRMVYAYLGAKFLGVSRQHYVKQDRARPKRIDFRLGGSNPVVAEFAYRPSAGGAHLSGSQDQSELRKLCRAIPSQAKLRALLLLDMHSEPLQLKPLQATYRKVSSGRGNFSRHPVRVIYVHQLRTFNIIWKP